MFVLGDFVSDLIDSMAVIVPVRNGILVPNTIWITSLE